MRFGVCTSLDHAPLLASLGFDFVEVHAGSLASMTDSEFAAFCQENKNAPIHTERANCLFPGELRLAGPEVDWDAVSGYIDKTLSRLSQAGIYGVCFGSGSCRACPEDFSKEDAWQQLVQVGRILAHTGAKYGVTVAMEPLRPEETNMVNSMAQGRRLVEEVNHPNFQLLCDLYHVVQNGDRPEDVAVAGQRLVHIHICKADDRHAMYPGDGIDYAAFYRTLKDMGYDGTMSFEGRTSDFEAELPGVLAVMRQYKEV